MPTIEFSLQSGRLFGEDYPHWRRLDAEDWHWIHLPDHLRDQVFRIVFARTPAAHLFEMVVSEQCPRDAYAHLARGIAKLVKRSVVVNVIHGRSPNAHLILWEEQNPGKHFHLDIDFNHLSNLDHEIISSLNRVSPHKLKTLFRLLHGRNLGDSFFRTLKKHLSQIPCPAKDDYHSVVDLALKLIFLIFVQRKGWLNFDPFYLESKMTLCDVRGLSIVHCFFKPLFARLEGAAIREIIPLGVLPCLGGGLFTFRAERLPPIPNEWVLDLYKTLVSRYSFSLFEAKEGRSIVGVGPELLGHVFENLLLHEDRRAQGAYYTPPEIAEKQVRSAIDAFLKRRGAEGRPPRKKILEKIRILDPSCGSGTYLVAAFQVLLNQRLALSPRNERYNGKLYALKRAIVLENLFGVDINPMAVRLTEVRLWLNMIQDLEVADPSKAPALPNLQHHLRPGDFLSRHGVDDIASIRTWEKYPMLERLRQKFPKSSARNRNGILKHIYRLERELHDYLSARESENRGQALKTESAQKMLPGHQRQKGKTRVRAGEADTGPLHIVFSRVMLEGGFDLILGNPPWLSASKLPTPQKKRILAHLQSPPGLSLRGQVDLSLYFLAASLNLLKPGGHLGFLMPGKILQARYAATLRAYLKDACCLDYLFDFGIDHNLLFRADTFPLAVGITRARPEPDQGVFIEKHGKGVFQSFWLPQRVLDPLAGIWPLVPPDQSTVLKKTKDWPRLDSLAVTIQRGVVTGNKKLFVFKEPPGHIPARRCKPLLRGRDIQERSLAPGRWIYWPFDDGPDWFGKTDPRERRWLIEKCNVKPRGDRVRLPYRPRPAAVWTLVWKYLANRWRVALIKTEWVPDQTTYYMGFRDFGTAYRFFVYLNSKTAETLIRLIAERAKDRCYFYYAHTCAALPAPPDLMTVPIVIPEEKDCFTPSEAPEQS